jgi:acyl-CoA thioesterase
MKTPAEIVDQMMRDDRFSQWMGVEILETGLGTCSLRATVHEDMLNGHNVLHGGITYSLSDSALAFASNSRGQKCMSIETSISHIGKCEAGEILTAHATEIHRGRSTGIYEVEIFNKENKKVSHFKGTVFVFPEEW